MLLSKNKKAAIPLDLRLSILSSGRDSNPRPSGPKPDALARLRYRSRFIRAILGYRSGLVNICRRVG